jgi:hypothetical protein
MKPSFRLFSVALLLAAAVAACAPGASADVNRFDYRDGATYVVPAGTTLFVTAAYDLDDLGLEVRDVARAGLRWIPMGVSGSSASAARLISRTSVDAPDGWEVGVWQTRIERSKPFAQRDDEDAPFDYVLRLTARVAVPSSAAGLTRRVQVEHQARDGNANTLSFLVQAD